MLSFIQAGYFLDGKNPALQKDVGILIEDGKISAVGNAKALAGRLPISESEHTDATVTIYDFSDKYILPGLLNAHVHLGMEAIPNALSQEETFTAQDYETHMQKHLTQLLQSGVTYVRNLGTARFYDIDMREKLRNAKTKNPAGAPGILCSGPVITIENGHGYRRMGIKANNVEECRIAAEQICKAGADTVKVIATGGVFTEGSDVNASQYTVAELKAVVETAHAAGKRTSAHAHGTEGIRNAVLAGIDSIEHGTFLNDELIELMLKKGTWLVPTLAAPYFSRKGQANISSDHIRQKMDAVYETRIRNFQKAYQAGVRIAVGTDAGTPYNDHTKTWCEIMLMTEHGVPSSRAIQIAAKETGVLMGIQNTRGTLELEKYADFIVLDKNPLENMDALSEVTYVFQNGICVKRPSI